MPPEVPTPDALPTVTQTPKRARGRPRKVRNAPTPEQLQALQQQIESDPLVQTVATSVDRTSTTSLDGVMLQLGIECARLKYGRECASIDGRHSLAVELSGRRIRALSKLARLVLERARVLGDVGIDPQDERLQKVVRAFNEQVLASAQATMPPEVAERFVREYEARVQGWEERLD
jgi:hypothetical protein